MNVTMIMYGKIVYANIVGLIRQEQGGFKKLSILTYISNKNLYNI